LAFNRLRAEQAYSGGISILTDYVRRVRPVRAPAFLTLVFAPGECAQVDWGCAGSMNNAEEIDGSFAVLICSPEIAKPSQYLPSI
jgi:hypothetical protein